MADRIIVFSGIDGCGKTTLIEELTRRLEERGHCPHVVWMRYCHYLSRVLFLFARLLGYTKYEFHQGIRVVGYHEFYRSKILSYLFVVVLFLDTLLASFWKIYVPLIFTKKTVVCDRWVPDILVDIEIDTGCNNFEASFGGRVFWRLMPKGTVLLGIKREIETVRKVRIENTLDRNFCKRYSLYEKIYNLPLVKVINNSDSVDSAVGVIERVLNDES